MHETIRWTLWNGTSLERQDISSLPDNRSQALTHLSHLVNRLQRKPEQYKKKQWGHSSRTGKRLHCKSNSTEKYRMVHTTLWFVSSNKPDMIRWICNAKATQSGISLSDKLLAGLNVLGNLLGILLQFWQGAIAIQGDIEAMFMQIGVRKKDRRYLRFMWRQPSSHELEVYVYQRYIFEASDSPACANFVLQQIAKDDIEDHPNSLEIIRWTFYKDDMVASVGDTSTAFTTAKDVKDTLKKAKFNLTKSCSNSREFVSRCKTIFANQLRSSLVKLFIKVFLEFIGVRTKAK